MTTFSVERDGNTDLRGYTLDALPSVHDVGWLELMKRAEAENLVVAGAGGAFVGFSPQGTDPKGYFVGSDGGVKTTRLDSPGVEADQMPYAAYISREGVLWRVEDAHQDGYHFGLVFTGLTSKKAVWLDRNPSGLGSFPGARSYIDPFIHDGTAYWTSDVPYSEASTEGREYASVVLDQANEAATVRSPGSAIRAGDAVLVGTERGRHYYLDLKPLAVKDGATRTVVASLEGFDGGLPPQYVVATQGIWAGSGVEYDTPNARYWTYISFEGGEASISGDLGTEIIVTAVSNGFAFFRVDGRDCMLKFDTGDVAAFGEKEQALVSDDVVAWNPMGERNYLFARIAFKK